MEASRQAGMSTGIGLLPEAAVSVGPLDGPALLSRLNKPRPPWEDLPGYCWEPLLYKEEMAAAGCSLSSFPRAILQFLDILSSDAA